jgi:RecA/RadA recombinase
LVVKKAVTLLTTQADSIANCISSFIFFATPHCGSNFADLAVVFKRLAKLILDPPNNFLRDLSTMSPQLQSLDLAFKDFLAHKDIKCVSYYEAVKRKMFFKNSIVVTRDSAILHVEREEAICLNADHSSIVQFRNAEDDGFKLVLGKLKELTQVSKENTKRHVRRRKSHVDVPFMPGRYFVGRKGELSKVRTWLVDKSQYEPIVIAFYGQSGVGKTQLALTFAINHQDHYDYVLFSNASSVEILRNDFTKIQKRLGVLEDSDGSLDRMVTWLSTRAEERWLLILDNANQLSTIVPYISRLSNAGQVILTTTDARVEKNEFIQRSLEVKTLSPEDSQTLLFTRAGMADPRQKDVEVAATLLEELGHLPLAVDSAGAYINVRRKSVTEYMNIFHDFQKDVLDHRPQASSYERSVVGTLELSFKEIDSRPNARVLLSLLIFLDRAEVTERFLKRGSSPKLVWGLSGEPMEASPIDRHVPSELVSLINNDFLFDEAIEELISLSIISCTNHGENGRTLMLHPLYHQCAKFRLSKDERRKYATDALCFLAHAFPSDEHALEKGYVFLVFYFGRCLLTNVLLARELWGGLTYRIYTTRMILSDIISTIFLLNIFAPCLQTPRINPMRANMSQNLFLTPI